MEKGSAAVETAVPGASAGLLKLSAGKEFSEDARSIFSATTPVLSESCESAFCPVPGPSHPTTALTSVREGSAPG